MLCIFDELRSNIYILDSIAIYIYIWVANEVCRLRGLSVDKSLKKCDFKFKDIIGIRLYKVSGLMSMS